MHIGETIQALRKQRKMSLSELADKSGVQIATLSRIEHNKMTGTLDSHMKIASALGIEITALYSNISRLPETAEVRMAKKTTDVFIHNAKSSYEILTPNVLTKKMAPILLKIEPQGQSGKEQNAKGTEKFLFILEGKIEARIGSQTHTLSKSSTLYFDASQEHYFINTGATTAKVICVGTPMTL